MKLFRNRKGDFKYELQFGRLVKVGKPRKRHTLIQHYLRRLLEELLDPRQWFVEVELPTISWKATTLVRRT